jgi:hypothetical protein
MEIPLEAQSLDVSVDRNASAFPTPNNIVGRVAIDTNIPTIGIDIGGIFQDDTSATFDVGSTKPKISGGDIAFNFASAMPTTNFSNDEGIIRQLSDQDTFIPVRFKEDFKKSTSTITDSIDIYNIDTSKFGQSVYQSLQFSASGFLTGFFPTRSDVDHPSAGTFSVGSTSIQVDDGTKFKENERVHLQNGTFVGTITGISSNTLSFSNGTVVSLANNTALFSFTTTLYTTTGQIVGSVVGAKTAGGQFGSKTEIKEITLDGFAQPVYEYVDYYMVLKGTAPPIERIINDKSIFLYPNNWRIDRVSKTSNSAYNSYGRPEPLAVQLKFSNDMAHTTYQNKTSTGANPSITQSGRHIAAFDSSGNRIAASQGQDIVVKVPIGGISTHSVNGNPASTLALIVKKALELTTDAMEIGFIDGGIGETIPDAFEVSISGPILKVKQKVDPINSNLLSVLEPCLPITASEDYTSGNGLAQIEFFTDNYGIYSVSANAKSAGDKVQDLIGLVSNAKKNRDLIRGIQIPYDSLIQSDSVTPTARNFFLTFGQQDNDAKGSAGNSLNASHTMIPGLLPGDLGGDPLPDRGTGLLANLAEFGDAITAIGSFVANFIGDTFITLLSDPHGNDGGIRIIPEKLHVRYDAGNNYYAFNLRLLASDFVIGV